MKKNYLLLLGAFACFSGSSFAQDVQPCGTDQMRKVQIAKHPELLKIEAEYQRQIQAGLKKIDLRQVAKTTGDDGYDIPIVIHVVHDYNPFTLTPGQMGSAGGDYITDDQIFNTVKSWNIVYAKQNADTIGVIAPFKKYIGNPRIRLHLATVDPSGNPTKGITRTRSYQTYDGGDNSKFEDWQPASYINIWFVNQMPGHSNAAAYAYQPPTAAVIPYYDGVISLAQYLDYSKTINHEIGHMLNLAHPWGNTNDPGLECGDDDVDDTPPTKGHSPVGCVNSALYDTTCAVNYFKIYTDDSGHITLVNYPDTTNAQNIMDYTYCSLMFTKGQVDRMHAALESSVAGRSNLWDPANLALTGALAPMPDLKPIPDFLVSPVAFSGYQNKNGNFVFPGNTVKFTNETWNDTLTHLDWTFSNGASKPNDTSRNFLLNTFTEPGWVNITMKATGNHTGDSIRTFNKSVFVADNAGRNVNGYMQEFDAAGDRDKWPSFNYYNNDFKWQLANVGMYDNSCIMYNGFDSRLNPATFTYPITGTPKGDVDDLFSIPMDVSGGGYLNFYTAAASRSSVSTDINDTLIIDYSVNKGPWTNLKTLGKRDLINNGSQPTVFVPSFVQQWKAQNIAIPSAAQTSYTTFRFRYRPGVGVDGYSSGNNFYMDRLYVSNIPAGVNEAAMANMDVAVVPNPTHGNAFVVVKDANNATAQIVVSDVTGKVVYTATESVSGNIARIEIPRAAIAVQGMYLVQTTTGSHTNTQKLVVY
jgi:hypothetical protein